jgi:hypothetical protein
MHERVEAGSQETLEPAAVPALRQGDMVQRVLALQRSAGNAAVTRLIARQPAGPGAIDRTPTEFVFILGAKDNAALKVAKEHYRSPLMSSLTRKVIDREDMSDPTLAGIFDYLRQVKYPISEITIVVHGDAEGDLIVPLNAASKSDKTTPDEVDKALDDGVLKPLNDGQITDKTRIRLQACFTGYGPRMVNLLDRAFGDGAGVVVAPTVEVAYAKDVWHSEGLSGWWVTSPKALTTGELAFALQAKYGKSIKLDLTTYQEDTGTHRKGEAMKDDAEMWAEIARKAKASTRPPDSDGTQWWVYVANPFVQTVRPGYEDDPVLYTKSDYRYSPTEL